MALTKTYHDPVAEIGADGFQSFTKLPAVTANKLLENDMYLKGRPVSAVSDYDGTVASTTSTSFTDLSGMSVNITTSGSSKLRITAAGSGNSSGTGVALYVTALVDGTNQGNATYGMAQIQLSGTGGFAIDFVTAAAVSDGAHTVKLRFRSSTGASVSVSHCSLVVTEVS